MTVQAPGTANAEGTKVENGKTEGVESEDTKNNDGTVDTEDQDAELGGIFERVDGEDRITAEGMEKLTTLMQSPDTALAATVQLANGLLAEVAKQRKYSRGWEKLAKGNKDKPGEGPADTDELAKVRLELAQVRAVATAGLPLELHTSVKGETPEEMATNAATLKTQLSGLFGGPAPQKTAQVPDEKRPQSPRKSLDDLLPR